MSHSKKQMAAGHFHFENAGKSPDEAQWQMLAPYAYQQGLNFPKSQSQLTAPAIKKCAGIAAGNTQGRKQVPV